MKLAFRLIVIACCALMLSGCMARIQARDALQAANRTNAVGAPFTRYLASEYRSYANHLLGVRFFGSSYTTYFARKAMAAADGVIVMPETPDNWARLAPKDILDLGQARPLLMQALDNGGRERAPELAARAQSRYDCWMMERVRRRGFNTNCKAGFTEAMDALLTALEAQVTPDSPESPFYDNSFDNSLVGPDGTVIETFPAPIGDLMVGDVKGALAPLQQAMFIVFFDWNETTLSASAGDVLDAIAQELKARNDVTRVVSTGHADTSGNAAYNETLSLARASAVRDALVARGVPSNMLRIEGRGENELLVPTPDNVREPGNRRTQITLE